MMTLADALNATEGGIVRSGRTTYDVGPEIAAASPKNGPQVLGRGSTNTVCLDPVK